MKPVTIVPGKYYKMKWNTIIIYGKVKSLIQGQIELHKYQTEKDKMLVRYPIYAEYEEDITNYNGIWQHIPGQSPALQDATLVKEITKKEYERQKSIMVAEAL